MIQDIKGRADVALIVNSFYDKVRNDHELSPIFNSVITDWTAHLERLTDFWEMSLFGGRKYTGNPLKAHQIADDMVNNSITPNHFGLWLNLWFETIDSQFEGENATTMKRRARKMQTPIMIAIFENRQKRDL